MSWVFIVIEVCSFIPCVTELNLYVRSEPLPLYSNFELQDSAGLDVGTADGEGGLGTEVGLGVGVAGSKTWASKSEVSELNRPDIFSLNEVLVSCEEVKDKKILPKNKNPNPKGSIKNNLILADLDNFIFHSTQNL